MQPKNNIRGWQMIKTKIVQSFFFLFDCIMNEQIYAKKTGSFTDAES